MATAARSAPAETPLGPDDLAAGVPPDALRRPASWRVAQDAQALVVTGERAGQATLHVEGVHVFAYRASTVGGALVLLLDGAPLARHSGASQANDISLDGRAYTLAWRFEPAGASPSFELTLLGTEPVLPPVAEAVVGVLQECVDALVPVEIRHAAPIPASAILATWDGAPLRVDATSALEGHRTTTRALVHVPAATLAPGAHELAVVVDLGEPEEVLRRTVEVVESLATFVSPGSGWIYDRTPVVSLSLVGCAADRASIRLFVDGEAVGDATTGRARAYRFPHELAFGETHSYRFEVAIDDRPVRTFSGEFTEGLDVLEYDLQDAEVAYVSALGHASFDARAGAGDALASRARAVASLPVVLRAEGPAVHVRAEYAPLELACTSVQERRICEPYGGGAPNYWTRYGFLAPADVTTEEGTQRAAGAGQLAAAAWFSRVGAAEIVAPVALVEQQARVVAEAASVEAAAAAGLGPAV